MIESNLPVLQVIIALCSAPICSLIRFRHVAWLFTSIVTFLTLIISILLAIEVYSDIQILYFLGNWEPPYGIEYRVDPLSSFMLVLTSLVGFVAAIYSKESVEFEINPDLHSYFYATYLLLFAGLLGIIITNDAFNVYVFLEISSLATYALIAMGNDRRSLTSAFEYLILGTIGATFILIAIGLLYMMTGTLNISDLAVKIQEYKYTTPIKAALAFLSIGFALKVAMFPLHTWLTNAYSLAPSFVAVFLSATATKVSIYFFIRFLYFMYGYDFSFVETLLPSLLMLFGILAIIICSYMAILQYDVKRILAYSSVAQLGYMILALGLANVEGLTAIFIHLFNHAIIKAALFMAAGCVVYSIGSSRLVDFKGLGRKMPYTMAAFLIAGLALIGVPSTSGFISKWYLLQALMHKDYWLIFAIVIISSILSIVYVWRVIEVAYFSERSNRLPDVKEAPISMLIPMWFFVVISIVFGVYAIPVIETAGFVADYIMNGL